METVVSIVNEVTWWGGGMPNAQANRIVDNHNSQTSTRLCNRQTGTRREFDRWDVTTEMVLLLLSTPPPLTPESGSSKRDISIADVNEQADSYEVIH